MPRIIRRDEEVAKAIRDGLKRVVEQKPRDARLRNRADAGTLRVNFDTVSKESKVKRHLFDRTGTPYEPEHLAIAERMAKRGKVEPLRKQLDRSREDLRITEEKLERSRTYASQLLTRMQKLDLEIARLKEELANGGQTAEQPLIGSGRVTVTPPVSRGKPKNGGPGSRQHRRGMGR